MQTSLSDTQIEAYQRDGVVLVKNAVTPYWVEQLQRTIEEQLDRPSAWANDANPGARQNRFFTDRYQWKTNKAINAFIHDSGCARLAAQAMDSSSARFYFDHLLVKEPGTDVPTPWHQDVPYWPFLGKQICSIWLALTESSIEGSALEFVRGSHLSGKYYVPEKFGSQKDHVNSWADNANGEKCPDIEADRASYDIIGFPVAPGDALIFSAWTLHGARGNKTSGQRRAAISTRWLGDDAVWHPHPAADPTVQQKDVCINPGDYPADDNVFPELWRAA